MNRINIPQGQLPRAIVLLVAMFVGGVAGWFLAGMFKLPMLLLVIGCAAISAWVISQIVPAGQTPPVSRSYRAPADSVFRPRPQQPARQPAPKRPTKDVPEPQPSSNNPVDKENLYTIMRHIKPGYHTLDELCAALPGNPPAELVENALDELIVDGRVTATRQEGLSAEPTMVYRVTNPEA